MCDVCVDFHDLLLSCKQNVYNTFHVNLLYYVACCKLSSFAMSNDNLAYAM